MELFIILSVCYLALTLLFYPDGFIKNSVLWIIFCAVYSIALLTDNHYLLFAFVAVAIIPAARYADIAIGELFEILPLIIAAAFWLSTVEFVDGFAFSQLAVVGGIIAISYLLFSQNKRLYLAVMATLFSYGTAFAVNGYFDVNAFAISLCAIWILCPLPNRSLRPNAKSLMRSRIGYP